MNTNLRSLVWVLDEKTAEHNCSVEIAYGLDALFVYRRETDLTEPVPRPRYYRADHRDVLRVECNWAEVDESFWQPVDETGSPIRTKA